MNRTEQMKLVQRAGIYIRVSEECGYMSFATLVIGVPLTLAAFAGMSGWPGVIFWTVSWWTWAIGHHYSAAASELHRLVNESRIE
jgi:hypothetical protein